MKYCTKPFIHRMSIRPLQSSWLFISPVVSALWAYKTIWIFSNPVLLLVLIGSSHNSQWVPWVHEAMVHSAPQKQENWAIFIVKKLLIFLIKTKNHSPGIERKVFYWGIRYRTANILTMMTQMQNLWHVFINTRTCLYNIIRTKDSW